MNDVWSATAKTMTNQIGSNPRAMMTGPSRGRKIRVISSQSRKEAGQEREEQHPREDNARGAEGNGGDRPLDQLVAAETAHQPARRPSRRRRCRR